MIACVGERTQDAPTPGIKCVRATHVYLIRCLQTVPT